MICYRPRYFKIYELVDKTTLNMFNESAFQFFNPQLLFSLDGIREYFGKPVTVNNWRDGGRFDSRGLRRPSDKTGAEFSAHRFGEAADFDVEDISAEEVRQTILNNKNHEFFQYITRMESGVSWVHIDCYNVLDRIQLFGAV